MNNTNSLEDQILSLLPSDGRTMGNKAVREALTASGMDVSDSAYEAARAALIASGLVVKGRGRGGSIAKVLKEDSELTLELQSIPEDAPNPKQPTKKKSPKKQRSSKNDQTQVLSYRYDDKRKNNPHVGMVDTHSDGVEEKKTWRYDPYLDPELQFDSTSTRAQVERLIDDALASGDQDQMKVALEELKRLQSPYLQWSGKAERTSFEVDTVSLHVHERIDPATILAAVHKRIKDAKNNDNSALQSDLFSAPFENLPMHQAIDFYKHERDWANRLIAGDSLLVMNSLLQKESMAGRVQMIYIDPPYGIKYGSNFQPFTNQKPTSRTDKDEDLTQEPEMIKAFRDTWELGIHSYLTYLRDRLFLARELLHESGSVFVQISDENHHLIRNLLEEIFGLENLIVSIPVKKKGSQKGTLLDPVNDYLVWAAKDKKRLKFRQLFYGRESDEELTKDFSNVDLSNGNVTTISALEKKDGLKPGEYKANLAALYKKYPQAKIFKPEQSTGGNPGKSQAQIYSFQGRDFDPGIKRGLGWKASALVDSGFSGMDRLSFSGRLHIGDKQLGVRRYPTDFGLKAISNWWDNLGGASSPIYVVQTNEKIIERCILMTTDPGDLVIDPTCGSGTTAVVAEKQGRRWITCDTSRVAVTLAKQRIMSSSFDYYELKYPQEGLRGGFIYKTVPHIMASEIANNPEIDVIYERTHPAIEEALSALNKATNQQMQEWEVPFAFADDWPEVAQRSFEAFHIARQHMQDLMDESIAAHSTREVLYDQPTISKDKLRITGPFTVEAVPFPTVMGLEETEQPIEADVAVARSGATSLHAQWRDELIKAGIRGKGGQKLKLIDLESLPGTHYIHAVGTVAESGERVAVSFGPEHAALEQRQVEIAMREASELFPLPKMLLFCAFTFDPEAAKDIDSIKGIQALKAQMNTDLLTEDLKKGRASNESFWLMGQPEIEVHNQDDGMLTVEVHGFDYFDTKTGELKSGGKKNIAMWALDTDYDDRSLYPRQVFFPMADKDNGWYKLKKDIRAELNEELLESFHGTVSLPFTPGDNKCVAVKIVDDRGIESLRVIRLD